MSWDRLIKIAGRCMVMVTALSFMAAGVAFIVVGFEPAGLCEPFQSQPWLVVVIGVAFFAFGVATFWASPRELFLLGLFGPRPFPPERKPRGKRTDRP